MHDSPPGEYQIVLHLAFQVPQAVRTQRVSGRG